MIVGVDPKNTELSCEERDKVVVKSLVKLQIGSRLSCLRKWEDGLIAVTFWAEEGYTDAFYVRDGLVETEPRERVDPPNFKICPCKVDARPHQWASLCYEGCGCPCALGQGYMSSQPVLSSRHPYTSHCRDFDKSKVVPDAPYVPSSRTTLTGATGPRGPTGCTGPPPPK